MKIFIISDVKLNKRSAEASHTIEIFENLLKFNKETYLFVPKVKDPIYQFKENVIFVPTFQSNNLNLFETAIYQLTLWVYLIYYSIKLSPDVIYTRMGPFTISPLLISQLLKIKYVVEINGLIVDEIQMKTLNKSYPKLIELLITSGIGINYIKLIEKMNYRHAKKIIAVTPKIKEELSNRYGVPLEKFVLVLNGANTRLFKPSYSSEAKRELNLDKITDYVCFVGSLSPWQGVEYLIQAAPIVIEKYPNVNFLIIGEGGMKETLICLANKIGVSDRILFAGAVPYERVPKYINASTICVLPKKPLKSGYSPLKLYEYMACGKPIVASNVEGLEILSKINAGILVNSENPEQLANGIIELLENKKLQKKMGKNGRNYVVRYHSWEKITKRILESLMDSSRREVL